MFSLKAELYKKQQQYGAKNETVPDTIRKQHKLKSSTSGSSEKTSYKKNPGVDERNEKDVLATSEEENKEAKVEAVLKAKAKLYEKMTSGDVIPSEESSSVFLVDFEQKSVEAWRSKHENEREKNKKPEMNVDIATAIKKSLAEAENDWVDYVDALGRTRKVRKKDVPSLRKMDEKFDDGRKTPPTAEKGISGKTLLSQDMRREAAREEWEKQAMEEVNGDLHYENLRHGENRELGVGYYSFSTDQETRDEQMKMLIKMREETKKEKESLKEMQRKKRTALQARLEKVRERKIKKLKAQGKEIPNDLLQPIQLQPEENSDEETNVEATIEDKRLDEDIAALKSAKVREWDKGKDWVPAAPERPPKSWKNPREERLSEFAPPSFYFKNSKKKNKDNESETRPSVNPCDNHSPGIDLLESNDNLEITQQKENNVIECVEKAPSGVSQGATNDVELRTNRVLNFLDQVNSETKTATHDIPESTQEPTGEYTPSTSDKPFSIKIKPLSSKTKTLLTKSALDDAS